MIFFAYQRTWSMLYAQKLSSSTSSPISTQLEFDNSEGGKFGWSGQIDG